MCGRRLIAYGTCTQGVSGTGKSTLGAALGRALRLPFIDGDDLHPVVNVEKMARGEPLEDEDRWPWLERVRRTGVECVGGQLGEGVGLADRGSGGSTKDEASAARGVETGTGVRDGPRLGVIVACSSLKKTYRAVLRGEAWPGSRDVTRMSLPTYFVYLKGDRDVLMERMLHRQGHFMKAGMLESQLDTLESPEDEPGVVTVSAEMSTEEQVQKVVEMLGS